MSDYFFSFKVCNYEVKIDKPVGSFCNSVGSVNIQLYNHENYIFHIKVMKLNENSEK